MTRPPVTRLVAMLRRCMVLAFGGIVVRLASLQVRDNAPLAAMGLQQRLRTIDAARRSAGRSSTATGTPLAVTLEARDVYADPRRS